MPGGRLLICVRDAKNQVVAGDPELALPADVAPAENTAYFATVNFASPGSPTTSAIVRPDGTLLAYQPYGLEGLLVRDIDLAEATRLLALRYKAVEAV